MMVLKRDRHRRRNKFLQTAFPYFFDTIIPRPGLELEEHLNDKSPKIRDLDVFIICENSDDESENFN